MMVMMTDLYQNCNAYEVRRFKNKDEWRENRIKFIGGSDAATLVGRNPWKSNLQLWQEKNGMVEAQDISDKPYVKYGTEAEPLLRELFKLDFLGKYEVQYKEDTMLVSKKYPWMAYSPDGLLIDKETGEIGILEIKTTMIFNSRSKEKWTDQIPDNYFCQVLHGLLVTEFDFVVLKAQLKTEYGDDVRLDTRHYYLHRNAVIEQLNWLMEQEELEYNKYYLEPKEPPMYAFI